MICSNCKSRFGSHYKLCPTCGSNQINQEKRIPLHYPELDLTQEPKEDSVLVQFTDLDDFGSS